MVLFESIADVGRSRSIGSFVPMSQDTRSNLEPSIDRDSSTDIVYPSTIPFIIVHLACFAAIWTGVTVEAVAIGVSALLAQDFRHRRGLPSLLFPPGL